MKAEVIDGKNVWTFDLKEFVGDDPLAQIYYEREMEWKKMLREGKTREEIEAYMATTDYEERIEKILYPKGKKKEPEWEIGQRVAIYRMLATIVPKLNGKNLFKRILIKRIGWEYYQGEDKDGELWEVELDNCDEEDYEWYLQKCTNPDFGNEKLGML